MHATTSGLVTRLHFPLYDEIQIHASHFNISVLILHTINIPQSSYTKWTLFINKFKCMLYMPDPSSMFYFNKK